MDKETRLKDLRRTLNICKAIDRLMQIENGRTRLFDEFGINKNISEIMKEIRELENGCDCEYCEGCEDFLYNSSVLKPDCLHIECLKNQRHNIVGLECKVKPEDFKEGW